MEPGTLVMDPAIPANVSGPPEDPDPSSHDPEGNTPPPTQQDLDQNNPPPFRPAPSFAEFLVRSRDAGPPASLEPADAILDSEIQEITPEEFMRSITTATNAAASLLQLKLPRSCKRLAADLATSIRSSKRAFEETGLVPDDEAIRIRPPPKPMSSSMSTSPAVSRNIPPKKRTPKARSIKPVDLLAKTANGASGSTLGGQSDITGTADLNHSRNTSNSDTPDTHEPTLPSPGRESNSIPSITLTLTAASDATGPAQTETVPVRHSDSEAALAAQTDLTSHPAQPASNLQELAAPGNSQIVSITNSPLTIILSDDIRTEVVKIHRELHGSKPSWDKYHATWKSLTPLLQTCARSMQALPPANIPFRFERTTCTYTNWIKSISGAAPQFLSPANNEQWNCPDIIDFPLLSKFRNLDNTLPPQSFIPTVTKTAHPESTLVRFLHRLSHPPPSVHTEWAKLVAASVDVMAKNLFQPPPVTYDDGDDRLTQGVHVLQYLEKQKGCSSSFDTTPQDDANCNNPADQPLPRSHSLDVLTEFRDLIIDVIMAYVIIQTHAISEPPLSQAQKKSNQRAHQTKSARQTQTVLRTQQAASAVSKDAPDVHLQLRSYSKKQNFQPLVYFVLGGVRGLFIASRNYRVAGITECMSFIQAISIISQRSTTARIPGERIWKNLSALLVQLLRPIFQSTNLISPNIHLPSRHAIAEAITNDFLLHWQTSNPTLPFLLPLSNRDAP
ncbi:hypothetical protein PTTG_05039 [Puccinia triticina 1-1 BBBD Race 1]|uniref:Uncharacterized protein n=1 Tax=Puccinia triticina (isolate 1-1 / race 1 (BBBD)) TaxID=630390 RepID=A0A180GDJ7_PUCT1|nr:hypothetical protein PTTG_05039 [Puccinia triticina 1-1 BBBD Race 1]